MSSYLITGIGGDIGQSISQIIRYHDQSSLIIGSDISEKNAGRLFCNHLRIVASAVDSEKYLGHILKLVAHYGVNYLIPTTESELEVISKNIHRFENIHVIYSGHKVVEICSDKLKTNEFLKSIGVPAPWTVSALESFPTEYPCIFKNRKGSGSKVLFSVERESDARFLAQKYPNGIFQELLLPSDQEITCGVFRSKAGEVAVIQYLRRLYGGTTSWAKTIFDSEVETMCRLVATELGLEGSMNVQLRLTDAGPRIFEINPRFSSTVLMRHLLGFEDVVWSIGDKRGLTLSYPSISLGIETARTTSSARLPNRPDS